MILCHLVSGEKSVTELEDLIAARQAAVSSNFRAYVLRDWLFHVAMAKRFTTALPTTNQNAFWKSSMIYSAKT